MNPIEAVEIYKSLLEQLPSMIKSSGLKDRFIYDKIGMPKTTFYKKVKDMSWSVDEVEALLFVLNGQNIVGRV